MKVALVMPPMDSGEPSHGGFRLLHELSKGKPHWTRTARTLGRGWRGFVDFEDFPKGLITLGTAISARHQVRIFNFINDFNTQDEVVAWAPDVRFEDIQAGDPPESCLSLMMVCWSDHLLQASPICKGETNPWRI